MGNSIFSKILKLALLMMMYLGLLILFILLVESMNKDLVDNDIKSLVIETYSAIL